MVNASCCSSTGTSDSEAVAELMAAVWEMLFVIEGRRVVLGELVVSVALVLVFDF